MNEWKFGLGFRVSIFFLNDVEGLGFMIFKRYALEFRVGSRGMLLNFELGQEVCS